MALRAHEVPVLKLPCPVEWIVRADSLVGIEMEPTPLFGIPGHAEGLESSAGELHQVLLQRFHAKGVRNLEIGHLPVSRLRH